MKIKTILYIIYTFLLATAFVGCGETEVPVMEDDLVAIELVGLGEAVQVTRAGFDPSLTEIHNATIIVFHGPDDEFLLCRTIDYINEERVYLKRGDTYKIFVIANLDDANCPDDFTAATYFDDVSSMGELYSKYFISSAEPGKAPARLPMISGTIDYPFEEITLGNPLESLTITLKLRSLYTKVSVNIYNLVSGSGSGVELVSYYANNLPAYSWIVEQAGDDYPQSLDIPTTGYNRSSLIDIRRVANQPTKTIDGKTYEQHSFDVYCLENRRGTVAGLTSADRKSRAPKYALEVNFQGNVNVDDVLQTYLLVGKGNDDNFDVERNCIYYVNGVGDVESDSRRMYLNVVISGDLESPEDGREYEF